MRNSIFAIILLLCAGHAFGQYDVDPAVVELIKFETEANPGTEKLSSELRDLRHIEIPLNELKADVAKYIEKAVAQELIFERNGTKYVRWILYPDATSYNDQIVEHAKKRGWNTEPATYFKAFNTASASKYVVCPNGTVFSAKVSTDNPPGWKSDKRLKERHMFIARSFSDAIQALEQKVKVAKIDFQYEVAGFAISEIDHAMTIRRVGGVATGNANPIPLFFVGHEEARKVAAKHGYSDVKKFVYEKVMPEFGERLGVLAGAFGMHPHTPHGQNFLYDPNTGVISVRDIQDLRLWGTFHEEVSGNRELLNEFPLRIDKNGLEVKVGLLFGNVTTGLDKATMDKAFFEGFHRGFADTTGVPLEKLQTMEQNLMQAGYSTGTYGNELVYLFESCHALLAGS